MGGGSNDWTMQVWACVTTEQIIEEREDSIKMKMRFKRFLSGFMAVATLASTIIQPVTVSASELEPEKIKND